VGVGTSTIAAVEVASTFITEGVRISPCGVGDSLGWGTVALDKDLVRIIGALGALGLEEVLWVVPKEGRWAFQLA
jgi:hypothetical protein